MKKMSVVTRILGHLSWGVLPAAVFCLGMGVTLYLWKTIRDSSRQLNELRFANDCDEIIEQVSNKVHHISQILLGTRGLFYASQNVTRDEWANYTSALNILENSGDELFEIGYTPWIAEPHRDEHVATLRSEGLTNYDIVPEGVRPFYAPVVYLSAFDPSNRLALGFDLYSETKRKLAMERAIDGGAPAISGKISHDGYETGSSSIGVIICAPLYQKGLALSSTAARRQAISGFVYAHVGLQKLIKATEPHRPKDIDFTIFENDSSDPKNQLFQEEVRDSALGPSGLASSFAQKKSIDFYGVKWTYVFRALPQYGGHYAETEAKLVLLAGTLTSLLLMLIIIGLHAMHRSALNRAEKLMGKSKEQEKMLEKSKQQLELALEGSGVGLWDWNIDTGEAVYTERWAQIMGYTLSELQPLTLMTWRNLCHPDDLSWADEVLGKHFAGETPYYDCEVRLKHKMGTWIWVHDRGRISERDPKGNPMRLTGIRSDISEQKNNLADSLRRTEELNQFFALTLDLLCIADTRGYFLRFNKSWETKLGYSTKEMGAMRLLDLVHADDLDATMSAITDAISLGSPISFKNRYRCKNGSFLDLEWQCAPSSDYLYAAAHDVTENVKLEHALVAAKIAAEQANLAKSTFLANMSHEIRTPMNAILGFTQILLGNHHALSEGQQQQLNAIKHSGEHLIALINDILEMSKIEAGKVALHLGDFDVKAVFQDIEQMFAPAVNSKNLRLTTEMSVSMPPVVRGDEAKLRQVLVNLVGNAVKFTKNGAICIRVKASGAPAVLLEVEVEDTGVGILPEELPLLFKSFMQTKSGIKEQHGTGLGLAISRHFVQMMGGKVGVKSEIGKGSIFSFNILLESGEASEVLKQEGKGRVLGVVSEKEIRVLIADDQADNRSILKEILGDIGFAIREAASGEEAIKAFEDWRPDLILMDTRMPGIGGNAAIALIRKQKMGESVKIICVSASAFEHDRLATIKAGADDFIAKPFDEETLLERIRLLLGTEYIHADKKPKVGCTAPVSELNTQGDISLAIFPADLVAQLQEAASNAEIDEIVAIVEQMKAHDAPTAQRLYNIAMQYDYQKLIRLIKSTKGKI